MKTPLVIGITGGIGSGKSTVANILRQMGYSVYATDKEAKRLQNESPELRKKITELFGNQAYNGNELNRAWVAQAVFADKNLLEKLNHIIHPAVKQDFLQWKKIHSTEKILFLESAILFESGFNTLINSILLISAKQDERIRRVMQRDELTKEKVLQRIENQLDDSFLKTKADFVIETDNEIPLAEKVKDFLYFCGE